MSDQRQQTFLKLKAPCVHLSSVTLKFRTNAASVKDVLRALEAVRDVLEELGTSDQLDPRLAEYALFPLAQQVFNEARRLSPRCLEVAAACVTILVKHGYGEALSAALGKQLLILMSMLAGAGPRASTEPPLEPPTDDLRIAAFQCMSSVIDALTKSKGGAHVMDDQGTRNVVDQLVYLLLEAITVAPSDGVQAVASEVLLQLLKAIHSRIFLASLLPRTASSLTKSLRPSTQVRRTHKVLIANLKALRNILTRTLADRLDQAPSSADEREALNGSWLQATTSQVKNVLLQVCTLRTNENAGVQQALEELCVAVIEDCQHTLSESIPTVLETLVILASQDETSSAKATCRYLLITYPHLAEMLRSSLSTWSRSLPRLMQAQDGRAKQTALQKLAAALPLLSDAGHSAGVVVKDLIPILTNSITNMLIDNPPKAIELRQETPADLSALALASQHGTPEFSHFLLNQESQRETMAKLHQLIDVLRQSSERPRVTRQLIDTVAESEGETRVAALWLALQLLQKDNSNPTSINDFLIPDTVSDESLNTAALLADLQATILPLLSGPFEEHPVSNLTWQLQALSLESIVLYAQTFPGETYRPELIETLYPVLSFLASTNTLLRSHAITALDKLAIAAHYSDTKDLLISNVDYLVNSIAWKLNTYSLAPEAPQILRMMVHLCGAQLIPYLDDLIQSVFAALDNYHGYPEWVELLFSTLSSIVHVSLKQPQLAITQGKEAPSHHKQAIHVSTESDILDDLSSRKRRKHDVGRSANDPPTSAPQRAWTDALDGPTFPTSARQPGDGTTGSSPESNENLAPTKRPESDEEPKLSKSHALLLSIAQSTIPHLASPSPRVRQLLLSLLRDISPLLGRDEDTYLPLINAIWPVIIPRLFAQQDGDRPAGTDVEEGERAYNIAGAADTVAVLCEWAGDFMGSRVEDVVGQMLRLFRQVATEVKLNSGGGSGPGAQSRAKTIEAGAGIEGAVDLHIVKGAASGSTAARSQGELFAGAPSGHVRTSKGLILSSLINMLLGILAHVRVTLDTGDAIMHALLPFMNLRKEVRPVLETYNADAVWLWDVKLECKRKGTEGMEKMSINLPVLRPQLRARGLELREPVVVV